MTSFHQELYHQNDNTDPENNYRPENPSQSINYLALDKFFHDLESFRFS